MITVVNKYNTSEGEYIGRPSPLGNPYTHMEGTKAEFKVSSREEAVEKYRDWLYEKIRNKDRAVYEELTRLFYLALNGDLKLKCYCAPRACHGDVIKEFLDAQIKKKMIFVFGSNLDGYHGRGAARFAYDNRGAIWGRHIGQLNQSYALPTCGRWDSVKRKFPPLPLHVVDNFVKHFIFHAECHPEYTYQVTRVGCGLAGYADINISEMFKGAPDNCLFDEKWKLYLPNKRFWGTF